MALADGAAATLTVSVDEPLPLAASVTWLGLKLHAMPDGAPAQARFTWLEKPPVDCRLTPKFPELPAPIVVVVGEMDPVIPPTVSCTFWVCVTPPPEPFTVTEKFPAVSVGGVVIMSVA